MIGRILQTCAIPVRRRWVFAAMLGIATFGAVALLAQGPGNVYYSGGSYQAAAYSKWGAAVYQGETATGSQTIEVCPGLQNTPDGHTFNPWSTAMSFTIDPQNGSVTETLTPSAVSLVTSGAPSGFATCEMVTATFSNAHGLEPGAEPGDLRRRRDRRGHRRRRRAWRRKRLLAGGHRKRDSEHRRLDDDYRRQDSLAVHQLRRLGDCRDDHHDFGQLGRWHHVAHGGLLQRQQHADRGDHLHCYPGCADRDGNVDGLDRDSIYHGHIGPRRGSHQGARVGLHARTVHELVMTGRDERILPGTPHHGGHPEVAAVSEPRAAAAAAATAVANRVEPAPAAEALGKAWSTAVRGEELSSRWNFVAARLAAAWRWLSTSRYTRSLEATVHLQRSEIDRLRAENLGLMNSMLRRGGYEPVGEQPRPVNFRTRPHSWQQLARQREMSIGADMVRKAKEAANAGH